MFGVSKTSLDGIVIPILGALLAGEAGFLSLILIDGARGVGPSESTGIYVI